jgi:hypothetical protein
MTTDLIVYVLLDYDEHEGSELVGVFASLEAAQLDAAETWGEQWRDPASEWEHSMRDTWRRKFAAYPRWTVIREEVVSR